MNSVSSWWSRSYDQAADAAEKLKAEIASTLGDMLELVSGDVPAICAAAKDSTADDWRLAQIAKAAAVGAATCGIPGIGYPLLPAELMVVMRLMHRCATGISQIRLGYADDDTFAGILAVWSGAVNLDNDLAKQVAAKSLATAGTSIGGPVGLKLSIKAFSMCTAAIAARKLGPVVAQKAASKLAAKLAAKATVSWIPFVSAAAGGGINYWIMDGIARAAEKYAEFIKKASALPDTTPSA